MRTTLTTTEILTALAAGQLSSDAAAELMAAATELTVPASAVAVGRVTVKELRARCKTAGIRGYSKMKKAELLDALAKHANAKPEEKAAMSDRRTVKELKADCKAEGIRGYSKLKRDELVALLATPVAERKQKLAVAGKQTVKAVKAELKLLGVKGYSKWNKARCVTELAKAVAAKNSAGASGVAGVLAVAAAPVK